MIRAPRQRPAGARGRAPARTVVAFLSGALLLGAPIGCGGASDETRPAADDAARASVRRFWEAIHRAAAARRAGDCDAAALAYEEALAIDPRHEDALYYLGHCRRDQGNQTAAVDAFRRLTEANPHSSRGHIALGALLASPADGGVPDLAAAERNFRRAHDINKEETGPMVRLGEVLLVRGAPAEAEDWFRSALKTNPKSVEAAFLIGYVRWQAGDRRGAREACAQAIRAATADVPVKGVLGEGDRRLSSPEPAPPAPGGPPAPAVAPSPGDAGRVVAPPLANPHGETLFSDLVAPLKGGRPPGAPAPGDDEVDRIYRPLRDRLQAIRTRAVSGAAPAPSRSGT